MKQTDTGDFGTAWGGISSLQLGLPLIWTSARRKGFSLADVATWMSRRPAQLAGLRKKGRIALGYHADFCIFAPDDPFLVDPAMIRHKHPLTPYADRTLTGTVSASILRGELIDLARPRGELLRRDPK